MNLWNLLACRDTRCGNTSFFFHRHIWAVEDCNSIWRNVPGAPYRHITWSSEATEKGWVSIADGRNCTVRMYYLFPFDNSALFPGRSICRCRNCLSKDIFSRWLQLPLLFLDWNFSYLTNTESSPTQKRHPKEKISNEIFIYRSIFTSFSCS